MKINSKFFHFPPFISTSWNHVVALHTEDNILFVSLVDGQIVEIPHLSPETLDVIFASHASFLEYDLTTEQKNRINSPNKLSSSILSPFLGSDSAANTDPSSLRIGFSTLDGFGSILQHNPAQANSPDIPKEILQKIGAIGKIIASEDLQILPKAEPHCNCMFCQIAKAVSPEASLDDLQEKTDIVHNKELEELPVTEEELKFCQWDIQQTGDKLYTVTNKIDNVEKYRVYLGEPVGCTCGKSGCEHILAVLRG